MTSTPLVKDLNDLVGAQHVLHRKVDKIAYNNDCWPHGVIMSRGREIHRNQPDAIVQPRSEHEVLAVVQWARRTGTPIVPYGAGSGVCGGALATQGGVVVDMKRLNQIVATREGDMTMRCQSGIIGMVMERELNRRGLTMGHYPSSLYCSSLGGYLAGRSAGQYSSRYGKIEDMVRSLRVVTGAGDVIETAPDPLAGKPRYLVPDCGPDLTQLMVGSEGTLGMITESTLSVAPLPTRLHYRGFQFSSVPAALDAIREVMQHGVRPAVVRLYDEFDSLIASRKSGNSKEGLRSKLLTAKLGDIAMEVLPINVAGEIRGRMSDVTRAVLGRVLGNPLAINAIVDVLPTDCLLIMGFEGTSGITDDESKFAFELMGRRGIDMGEEPGLHWYQNRMSVSYKQSALYDAGAFVDTMEVSTTWSNLNRLYQAVKQALAPHVFVMAHFSHVYPEGSSIYFTFAGFGADLDETIHRYQSAWRAGLDAVARTGSSVAHHHGVGLSKSPWTHFDHPGGAELFGAMKASFDPDHIMNPGKVYPDEAWQ